MTFYEHSIQREKIIESNSKFKQDNESLFKYNKKLQNIYTNGKISLKSENNLHTILLLCVDILPIFPFLTISLYKQGEN